MQRTAASHGILDRARQSRAQKIHCMEPASFRYAAGRVSGRLVSNPGIYSQHGCAPDINERFWGAPRCPECKRSCRWARSPKRVGRLWTYPLWTPERYGDCKTCNARTGTRLDFVRSPYRLVIGGTVDWWEWLGWDLHLRA